MAERVFTKITRSYLALGALSCVAIGCENESASPARVGEGEYVASCIGIAGADFDPPAVLCVGGLDGSVRELGVAMTPGVAPALSADRSRIALVDSDRLVVVSPTGDHLTEVANQPGVVSVQWLSDGAGLVVQREVDSETTIEQINLDDGATSVLAGREQLAGEISPGVALSPDGRTLAFATRIDGKSELHLLRLGTAEQETIFQSAEFIHKPDWSPDGSHIAVVVGLAIESIDVHDGSHEVIAATGRDVTSPTWSPTGEQLLFVDSRGALLLVSTRGSGQPEPLVDHTGDGNLGRFPALPQWS